MIYLEELKKSIQDKKTLSETSKDLNLSISAIRYYLRKYNLLEERNNKLKNKGLLADKEKLSELCETSLNALDLLQKVGLKPTNGNYKTLYKMLDLHELYVNREHKKYRWKKSKYTNEDRFCINSKVSRDVIKKYILKNLLLEYKCSICGLENVWNNKPLVLQLEHKNGVYNDNRLENLTFLYPNCHTQTKTYSGKNNLKK